MARKRVTKGHGGHREGAGAKRLTLQERVRRGTSRPHRERAYGTAAGVTVAAAFGLLARPRELTDRGATFMASAIWRAHFDEATAAEARSLLAGDLAALAVFLERDPAAAGGLERWREHLDRVERAIGACASFKDSPYLSTGFVEVHDAVYA